ncbi:PTS sugar transporter subunit IIA [Streptobacillus moniliformis]|uniref:PTS sugar transporter subunit IIA n=1 Tax=Streptobacillus moniliformis TaxID=34105 RepID=UPI0007E3D5BD|nr:PTS sugar transporter subunit IIA [Streptobacillus moniliformis]QXW65100.1 PTS sugar transporter subunit IIA [Streptobacillus moniliformis]
MNIVDSLKDNKSIKLGKNVSNWQEAIELLFEPLLKNGSVKPEYPKAIIDRTNEIGPFYIIGPGIAMPHERGEMGAIKNAFTFLTLNDAIEFPTGEMIDILIGFSATDSETHIAEVIPQIVTLFDDEESFDRIRDKKTPEELLAYIEEIIK